MELKSYQYQIALNGLSNQNTGHFNPSFLTGNVNNKKSIIIFLQYLSVKML